jgi:hypothetical protein
VLSVLPSNFSSCPLPNFCKNHRVLIISIFSFISKLNLYCCAFLRSLQVISELGNFARLLNWGERRGPDVCECSDFKVLGLTYMLRIIQYLGIELYCRL